MKKIISITVFLTLSLSIFSQKKDTFLLLETGYQNINNQAKTHFGIGLEYFLSKKNSLSLRAKYLQTGIEYSKEGSSAGFAGFFGTSSKRFLYEGSVLSIPINYKFESRFFIKKINFFFNTGFALNFTLSEDFLTSENLTPNYNNKTYINFNLGTGFIYKLNNKIDLFLSGEIYAFGGAKTKEKVGFIFDTKLRPDTSVLNLGIRYRFKNK